MLDLLRLPRTPDTDTLLTSPTRDTYLAWAIMLLAFSNTVLVLAVCYVLLRPEQAYWHGVEGPGMLTANEISDGYATDWAARFLETRYSFQPNETLKESQDRIKRWIHPDLLKRYEVEFEAEEKMVKQAQLGTQTTVIQQSVTKRVEDVIHVHLVALRTVTIGDRKNRMEDLVADLALRPYPPQGRAARLVLANIALTPKLTLSGQ